MIKINTPTELQTIDAAQIMIHGMAGVGKSALVLGVKKSLWVVFDKSNKRTSAYFQTDCDIVVPESYQDVKELFTTINLTGYDTIVVDGLGIMLDLLEEELKKIHGAYTAGVPTPKGHQLRNGYLNELLKMIDRTNKNIIYTVHQEEKITKNDTIRYTPSLSAKAATLFSRNLDLILCLTLDGTTRILDPNASLYNIGKNSIGLPVMEVPVLLDDNGEPIKENNFFQTQILDKYYEYHAKQQKIKQESNKIIEEITQKIKETSTCEELNYIIENIDTVFNHVGRSKAHASREIQARAKELNFTFNKEEKRYE